MSSSYGSTSTRVWVRASVLDKAFALQNPYDDDDASVMSSGTHFSARRSAARDDDEGGWGWALASVLSFGSGGGGGGAGGARTNVVDNLEAIASGSGVDMTVLVEDESSKHDGAETIIPPSALGKKAKDFVVMANPFAASEETDEMPPDDLIGLTHLHEPSLVHSLKKRYERDVVYTATGAILLALNPFKDCGELYSDDVMGRYWAAGEGTGGDLGILPPHVYGSADRAFRSMMFNLESQHSSGRSIKADVTVDQSLLVSGESGAGKTVTTKHIMGYLATLSQRKAVASPVGSPMSDRRCRSSMRASVVMDRSRKASRAYSCIAGANIEQKILESNPILESFGNARTVRNDNSSRFGKYIELQFKSTGTLVGATIETYLLEKVRLVTQEVDERNYHIFYELLAGATEDEREEIYMLGEFDDVESFRMTSSSGTYDRRDGVDDYDEFDALVVSMGTMGFTDDDQKSIFRIVAALLHASNLSVLSVSADESKIDGDNPHLTPVLELLGFRRGSLNDALCSFEIKAGRETHVRSLPKEKAEFGLEALIKATYGALFEYIVGRVNENIHFEPKKGGAGGGGRAVGGGGRSRSGARGGGGGGGIAASIGVLDIFGFESFKRNSFEQLCINYCNEALQQQFNRFVFKSEQEEYKREGIEWSFISFPDNQDVLDLIDAKKTGIISILDGHCSGPGTTDKTFASDIYKKCKPHPRFEATFRQEGAKKFGVIHYAGPVEYDTVGFVEKNKDELPRMATELLKSSSNDLVKKLGVALSNPASSSVSSSVAGGNASSTRGGRGARGRPGSSGIGGRSISSSSKPKRTSVGAQFVSQLRALRTKIDSTEPHYVRCLKPNSSLVPDCYDPNMIADQLRCAGVLEAVRVSRVGYPQRYTHSLFLDRYAVLGLKEIQLAKRKGNKNPCDVLAKVAADQIVKSEQKSSSEEKKEGGDCRGKPKGGKASSAASAVDLAAVGIQLGKTKVFLRQPAFDKLERLRGRKMDESAVRIQTSFRTHAARKLYRLLSESTLMLQCWIRVLFATWKVQGLREAKAATAIRSFWLSTTERRMYLRKKSAAIWCQRFDRGRRGRVRYAKLDRQRRSIVIQSSYRGYRNRTKYGSMKRSAIAIQCAARCRSARTTLKELKADAKSLDNVMQEREALRREAERAKRELEEAKRRMAEEAERAAAEIVAKRVAEEEERRRREAEEEKRRKEEEEAAAAARAEEEAKRKEASEEEEKKDAQTKEEGAKTAAAAATAAAVVVSRGADVDSRAATAASSSAHGEDEVSALRSELESMKREMRELKKEMSLFRSERSLMYEDSRSSSVGGGGSSRRTTPPVTCSFGGFLTSVLGSKSAQSQAQGGFGPSQL